MTKEKKDEFLEEVKDLCEQCGNELVEEDGFKVCPKCDAEIDFFGDDEDE